MNRLALLSLWIALVSCAPLEDQEEMDEELTEDKIILKQLNQLEERIARALLVHEEVVKSISKLNERLSQTEAQLNSMDLRLSDVETKVKAPPAAPSTPPPTGVTATPPPPDEAAIRSVHAALKDLQAGTLEPEAALRSLEPVAVAAAPILRDELRKNLLSRKYADALSFLLARLPAEAVRGVLTQSAREEAMRNRIADILGERGDRDLSRILEEYLPGAEEDGRLVLGQAMTRCKNPAGLAPLVALLKSERKEIRFLALSTLKKVTGDDFAFRPFQPSTDNDTALACWEGWLEGPAKTLWK